MFIAHNDILDNHRQKWQWKDGADGMCRTAMMRRCAFFPDDMMETYRTGGYDVRMLEPSKALILTDEEYYQNTPLTIGAVIEDHPYFSQAYSAVALIIPLRCVIMSAAANYAISISMIPGY